MHTYVNLLPADDFVDYPQREDAIILGGTLHASTFRQLRKRLRMAAGDEDILHLTISLPEGMIADRETLLKVVETDLRERGVPPAEAIWTAVQHNDTACIHVHVGVAMRTWSGLRLEPWISEEASRHISGVLAETFGLKPITYFDAAALPRLVPPLPKRRQKGRARSWLAQRLTTIFGIYQPESLQDLNDAFETSGDPWRVTERPNRFGVLSFHAQGGGFEGFLGSLGPALEPAAMRARFALAGLLRQLRPAIGLRALIPRLAEVDRLKRNDPDEFERRLGAAGGGDSGGAPAGGDETSERHAAPAASFDGPSPHASRPGGAGHGDPALPADDPRLGGVEPHPAGAPGHRRDARGAGGGDRGRPVGNAGGRIDEGPGRDDASADAEHQELTIGHWLGEVCRSLRVGQRFGGLDWSTERVEAIVLDETGQPVIGRQERAPGLE